MAPVLEAPRIFGPTLTGDIRRIEAFRSAFLDHPRNLHVYVPPDYEQSTVARYPVLYLQDGQNVFDGTTSHVPGQEWEVDETAERLISESLIEPLIIVAIDHAGPDRINEFTPTYDPARDAGGQAHLYARMLVEEIKPLIDRMFRTDPSASATGLGGSSLGGLVTLVTGLERPDVFGRLAALSPSVWWDNRSVIRQVKALADKPQQRIWLDVGTREGVAALRDVRALKAALTQKGWQQRVDFRYYEAKGGEHSERAWRSRVAPVLRFLFPPR